MTSIDVATARQYVESGWWGTDPLHEIVRVQAAATPDRPAFITPPETISWHTYDRLADDLAATLVALGLPCGTRIAVRLPDTALIHAAMVATARAGVVAVGIGARAGTREIAHLVQKTQARTLISIDDLGGRSSAQVVQELRDAGVALDFHVVLSNRGVDRIFDVGSTVPVAVEPGRADRAEVAACSAGPNDLSMLNSTSGTTGLPNCVTQLDNRWIAFGRLAIEADELGENEVFFGGVPARCGFGPWTSHYAPTMLGAPTVALPKFDAETMLAEKQVNVLCCVSTQFRMLLNSPPVDETDLSSLRVMFAGGEAVPPDRAVEFENRTGAAVLQFFGSNENGAFSVTRVSDTSDRRLNTSGRSFPTWTCDCSTTGGGRHGHRWTRPARRAGSADMCRLLRGRRCECAAVHRERMDADVFMIEDGYLTPVGRTSDIIIRGGKNISAPQVEQEVETLPAVDLAGVVIVPDPVFGERVCAVVSLPPGQALTLPQLTGNLADRGVSKELYPEHLMVDQLPRSSDGKVAKGDIRTLAPASVAAASSNVIAS